MQHRLQLRAMKSAAVWSFMKHWLYIWVLLPSVVWNCKAEQLSSDLKTVAKDLLSKQSYSTPAVSIVEAQLTQPSDPLTSLTVLATDKNSEVRMIAAQLLAPLGMPDGAKILWNLLLDDNEAVRMMAVWAIGRLNESTPVTPDVSGLKDPRANVRRLTAETLARLHNPSVESDLITALSDSDDLVRWQAVTALGSCGSQRALTALSQRLQDSSARVRRTTAIVLSKLGNSATVAPLVAALDDVDWQTRAAAAKALAALVQKLQADRTATTDAIFAKLKSDDLAFIFALQELGLADDERALNGLVRVLTGNNRSLATHATQAILGLRLKSILPLLATSTHHTNPEVRQHIIEIFGKIGGANEVAAVIGALGDPVDSVQLAAVTALCKLRQYVQADRLTEKLVHADPHVRAATARFFGELGEKRFANKIATLIFDENRYVRSAAVEALGKIGDRSAIGSLVDVLTRQTPGGESTGARQIEGHGLVIGTSRPLSPVLSGLELVAQKAEAIKILGDWHASEAVVPIIENGLQAKDARLLAVSAYALGQIGDRRALGPLLALIKDFYTAAPFETDYLNQVVISDRAASGMLHQTYDLQCNVRGAIIWALGRLGDPLASPLLRQALTDRSSVVRDAANEALAKLDTGRHLLAQAYVNLPGFKQPSSLFFGYGAFAE